MGQAEIGKHVTAAFLHYSLRRSGSLHANRSFRFSSHVSFASLGEASRLRLTAGEQVPCPFSLWQCLASISFETRAGRKSPRDSAPCTPPARYRRDDARLFPAPHLHQNPVTAWTPDRSRLAVQHRGRNRCRAEPAKESHVPLRGSIPFRSLDVPLSFIIHEYVYLYRCQAKSAELCASDPEMGIVCWTLGFLCVLLCTLWLPCDRATG